LGAFLPQKWDDLLRHLVFLSFHFDGEGDEVFFNRFGYYLVLHLVPVAVLAKKVMINNKRDALAIR
jgi:hypothetical protein